MKHYDDGHLIEMSNRGIGLCPEHHETPVIYGTSYGQNFVETEEGGEACMECGQAIIDVMKDEEVGA